MPLPKGIYVPILSFWHDDEAESLDLDRTAAHCLDLAKAGVVGLVLQGSTGEAVCMTREERKALIKRVVDDLKAARLGTIVIAGTGGQCLQESIMYRNDAQESGAHYAIALSPSYFIGQMTEAVLEDYFTTLADRTGLPLLIYNFPAVTNGINLSAQLLARLSAHPKILGCKLTCNTIAKMAYLSPSAGNLKGDFAVFTGSSEYLPSAIAAGTAGAITGLANLFPRVVMRAWEGNVHMQNLVTRYEVIMMKAFLPGMRASLEIMGKSAGRSRSPVPQATTEEIAYYEREIQEIWKEEQRLSAEA